MSNIIYNYKNNEYICSYIYATTHIYSKFNSKSLAHEHMYIYIHIGMFRHRN